MEYIVSDRKAIALWNFCDPVQALKMAVIDIDPAIRADADVSVTICRRAVVLQIRLVLHAKHAQEKDRISKEPRKYDIRLSAVHTSF